MGVVARADASIPNFTDPWKVKDVSYLDTRVGGSALTALDCLCLHHWYRHVGRAARMVPLGCRVPVLHCQGLPESRDH